jgi:hypothetical protein
VLSSIHYSPAGCSRVNLARRQIRDVAQRGTRESLGIGYGWPCPAAEQACRSRRAAGGAIKRGSVQHGRHHAAGPGRIRMFDVLPGVPR